MDNKQEAVKAPVIIPTLNRYIHFKRCLESLERCTWADQTDVYIGLDFPPSDSYVEGWKMIDSYLAEKEIDNKFRNLFVRRRAQNCGVRGPDSNEALLYREVKEKYPYYIFTEDDNEFSPSFLVFLNKGLSLFENREDVLAISGYLFPDVAIKEQTSAFLSSFSNAWGTGYWTSKRFKYTEQGGSVFVDEVLSSWSLSWRLFNKRAASLNGMLSMHFRKRYYGDVLKTSELLINNKYSLFPSVSTVRNWGHDGSGVHCASSDKYIEQIIDNRDMFEFGAKTPIIQFAGRMDFGLIKKIAVLIRYICFRLIGKDLMAFYWKNR